MSEFDKFIEEARKSLPEGLVEELKRAMMLYYAGNDKYAQEDDYDGVIAIADNAADCILEWGNLMKKYTAPKFWHMTYKLYLQSPEWQEIRKRKLKSAGYKCQLCGKTGMTLEVHHNNYKNLGEEKDSDLVVLCANCHGTYHKEGKVKK